MSRRSYDPLPPPPPLSSPPLPPLPYKAPATPQRQPLNHSHKAFTNSTSVPPLLHSTSQVIPSPLASHAFRLPEPTSFSTNQMNIKSYSDGSMTLPLRKKENTFGFAVEPRRTSLPQDELGCVSYDQTNFSVKEIVSKSVPLPMKTRVVTSLYGVCGEESLLDEQLVNLHFIKETEIVQLDVGNDCIFKIPLHSSVEFGIMYNPNGDVHKAMNGYWFQTIGDLIEAKPAPNMVYVSKTSKGKGKLVEQTVKTGDILVPLSIKTKGTKPMYLKCLCMQTDEVKRLPLDCKGCFTTTPNLLRMHLEDLLKHAKLPQDVLIVLSTEQKNQLPLELNARPYTLLKQETMLSVIATTDPGTEARNKEKDFSLVEIATGLDIEFEHQALSGEEFLSLTHQTNQLFQSFSPKSVDSFVDDLAPGSHETQKLLNTYYIREGEGYQLHLPDRNSAKIENQKTTETIAYTPVVRKNARAPQLPAVSSAHSQIPQAPPCLPPHPPAVSSVPPQVPRIPQIPPSLPPQLPPINRVQSLPESPVTPCTQPPPPPPLPPPNPVVTPPAAATPSRFVMNLPPKEPHNLMPPPRILRPSMTNKQKTKPAHISDDEELDDYEIHMPAIDDKIDTASISSRGSTTSADYECIDENTIRRPIRSQSADHEIIQSLRDEMSKLSMTCTKLKAELDNVKRRLQGRLSANCSQ